MSTSNVTRELVTIQESSFVYDSTTPTDINHDFLFRDGRTPLRQETYTPRVLCVDVQGSLHTLPALGTLYSPPHSHPSTSDAAWEGPVQMIHQLSQEKNQYLMDLEEEEKRYNSQPTDEDKDICVDDLIVSTKGEDNTTASTEKIYDLSKSVRVWSDFLRPHLHPNSIYLLNSLHVYGGRGLAGDGEGDLWGFPSGTTVFQREDVEEEITDRIRLLAESCNSLQGFQLLSDVHNGMGGVSSGILHHFADDYGSKDTITFAITPPHLSPTTTQTRLLTQAAILQSYAELSQLSSVLVPLCLRKSIFDLTAPVVSFPSLLYQEDNAYLSSSILGAFLETASTVYRTRTDPLPLAALTHLLTPTGRKVAGAGIVLPYKGLNEDSEVEYSESERWGSVVERGDRKGMCGGEREMWRGLVPLSAGACLTNNPISEVQVVRGNSSTKSSREENKSPLERCCVRAVDPLKTTPPFPAIFTKLTPTTFNRDPSMRKTKPVRVVDERVRSVSSAGVIQQCPSLCQMLRPALTAAQGLDVTKVTLLQEEGLDKDAWCGVVEGLQKLLLAYDTTPNQEMECSDDDDDD
ncbi:hypothetical protein Pcinc_022512 [Petrolisthes cinctipes]|uniref:Tubulin nucleotide-binding domain-like protein n=1 Tax=Petrolisthes cinctipes TaxID=88211 RepID=A0AAE1FE21_PETCI|nr:hypothetical protein Pcinc_022512 [Petrolisthes cinctipes]